jgi:uncharacterized membrane protein
MSRSLPTNSFRAVRSARGSWESADSTCTAWNQPIRTICAMARASVRSVFTGMVLGAALSYLVSSTTTRSAPALSPA